MHPRWRERAPGRVREDSASAGALVVRDDDGVNGWQIRNLARGGRDPLRPHELCRPQPPQRGVRARGGQETVRPPAAPRRPTAPARRRWVGGGGGRTCDGEQRSEKMGSKRMLKPLTCKRKDAWPSHVICSASAGGAAMRALSRGTTGGSSSGGGSLVRWHARAASPVRRHRHHRHERGYARARARARTACGPSP